MDADKVRKLGERGGRCVVQEVSAFVGCVLRKVSDDTPGKQRIAVIQDCARNELSGKIGSRVARYAKYHMTEPMKPQNDAEMRRLDRRLKSASGGGYEAFAESLGEGS